MRDRIYPREPPSLMEKLASKISRNITPNRFSDHLHPICLIGPLRHNVAAIIVRRLPETKSSGPLTFTHGTNHILGHPLLQVD
ncbi:MAG: hypothetical protein O7C72_05925 [Deltaproteobacteria bacterium]|nr:hypothetical protein [Deltaproteobacteria bacterium]